jgi:hypothetical protein
MNERVAGFQIGSELEAARRHAVAAASGSQPQATIAGVAATAAKTAAKASGNAAAKRAPKATGEAANGAVGRMQAMVATAFKQEPDWKDF